MLTLAGWMGGLPSGPPHPLSLLPTRPSPRWDPGLQHQVLSHLWSSSLWPPRPLSILFGGFKRGMWIVVWDKPVLVMDVSVMAEFGYKQQKTQIKVAQSIRTCIVSLPRSTELGDPEPVERLPDASKGPGFHPSALSSCASGPRLPFWSPSGYYSPRHQAHKQHLRQTEKDRWGNEAFSSLTFHQGKKIIPGRTSKVNLHFCSEHWAPPEAGPRQG